MIKRYQQFNEMEKISILLSKYPQYSIKFSEIQDEVNNSNLDAQIHLLIQSRHPKASELAAISLEKKLRIKPATLAVTLSYCSRIERDYAKFRRLFDALRNSGTQVQDRTWILFARTSTQLGKVSEIKDVFQAIIDLGIDIPPPILREIIAAYMKEDKLADVLWLTKGLGMSKVNTWRLLSNMGYVPNTPASTVEDHAPTFQEEPAPEEEVKVAQPIRPRRDRPVKKATEVWQEWQHT
eukprot:TRINITY_DN572_c0_g2_i1.p1 TRINITY_DN572_c0_g2~~TRINITY_DN572_c0_g2_i1.p1  ORF type:complete len:238 (-),score=88.89 TRINITY_DN572_c0_g2_i1:50-763(-)